MSRGPVMGIETATLTGGVALLGERGVIAERLLDVRATYSERLLPSIQAMLSDAGIGIGDLGGIAVSVGPGSFTGLRIGIATAQGLGLAAGVPLAAVGTLEALAWSLWPSRETVAVVLDARRGEVYGAAYRVREEGLDECLGPSARTAEEFALALAPFGGGLLTGPGAALLEGELRRCAPAAWRTAPAHLLHPRPAAVAELGRRHLEHGISVLPERLTALYLRPAAARPRFGTMETVP